MKIENKKLGLSIALALGAASFNASAITTGITDRIGAYEVQNKVDDTTAMHKMNDRLRESEKDAGQVASLGVFQDATGAQNLSNQSTVNVTRQASVGNSCTIGQLATNASGKLLSCENGRYTEAMSGGTTGSSYKYISDRKGKYLSFYGDSRGGLLTRRLSTSFSKYPYGNPVWAININSTGDKIRSLHPANIFSGGRDTWGSWVSVSSSYIINHNYTKRTGGCSTSSFRKTYSFDSQTGSLNLLSTTPTDSYEC